MTPTGFDLSPLEVPILGVHCLNGLTGKDTSVSSECLHTCEDGDSTRGKSCRPFVPSLLQEEGTPEITDCSQCC